jgi:Na+/proline symporter
LDREAIGLLVMLLTVAIFAGLGIRYSMRRIDGVEDFISARSTVGGVAMFASVVASGVGAWILFSPAETGTFGGLIGLIGYGLGAAAPLLLFALIGPRIRRLMPQGHSLTEYVWHRFGNLTYAMTLAIALFYMFIFLAAEMTGIALAVHLIVGTPLGLTALIVGVATAAYTTYGGLRASIFTDGIQAWLILPLLALLLVVAAVVLGGPREILAQVSERQPQLLDLGHGPGLEFAAAVIIAVMAANMFHQGYWQRVYAARDVATVRRSYLLAAVVVVPLVIMPGLFGLMAVGMGEVEQPSIALFGVALQILPDWLLMTLLVLGLALVMSSMDTLLNGVASLVATDLARLRPGVSTGQLLRWSKIVTAILPIPAIYLASQGYSVLYLFFIADMVCAAAVFPIFLGMYARRLSGSAAAISIVAGLIVGTLFFPDPGFTRGNLLLSFGGALASSAAVATILTLAAHQVGWRDFDFKQLQRRVHTLDS